MSSVEFLGLGKARGVLFGFVYTARVSGVEEVEERGFVFGWASRAERDS